MLAIYHDPSHPGHDPGGGHPERPERIEACIHAISAAGIQAEWLQPKAATRADLESVHDPSYLDALERLGEGGGGWIDPDTYVTEGSLEIAARATGAVRLAVEQAMSTGRRSFCLSRPPGHHAEGAAGMGFCLLNHAAGGARAGLHCGAERVLIFDFDVHHGNGTQEIFWNDPRVLYISVHQFPWYPWRTGALQETGGPDAGGTNINIPLPAGGGDEAYLWAMVRVVGPAARRFDPDLMIVSAGFDAHQRDPLSLMEVTTGGFGRIVEAAVALAGEVCEGRLVATLEGGYDLEALGSSVAEAAAALAGPGRWPKPEELGPEPSAVEAAGAVNQQIWQSH